MSTVSPHGMPETPKKSAEVQAVPDFRTGAVVSGTRYRVVRLIGQGGMGRVYEVEHVELGKRFVLKALLKDLTRRTDLVARLRNEWRALGRLNHPNIVDVTDAGSTDDDIPFFVMERLEGETLGQRLKRDRRLPIGEAITISLGVLEGLSAAHDIDIVHRDVKPPNVFLKNDGSVKLLDFGVAKVVSQTGSITMRGVAIGTPRYMSPEQARGETVDGRADLYATGLLLFEMLTGGCPFDDARDANELLISQIMRPAPLLSEMISGIPRELEIFVAMLLAKDPKARPADAHEAAELLRGVALRVEEAPRPAPRAEPRDDKPSVGRLRAARVAGPSGPLVEAAAPGVAAGGGIAVAAPASSAVMEPGDDSVTCVRPGGGAAVPVGVAPAPPNGEGLVPPSSKRAGGRGGPGGAAAPAPPAIPRLETGEILTSLPSLPPSGVGSGKIRSSDRPQPRQPRRALPAGERLRVVNDLRAEEHRSHGAGKLSEPQNNLLARAPSASAALGRDGAEEPGASRSPGQVSSGSRGSESRLAALRAAEISVRQEMALARAANGRLRGSDADLQGSPDGGRPPAPNDALPALLGSGRDPAVVRAAVPSVPVARAGRSRGRSLLEQSPTLYRVGILVAGIVVAAPFVWVIGDFSAGPAIPATGRASAQVQPKQVPLSRVGAALTQRSLRADIARQGLAAASGVRSAPEVVPVATPSARERQVLLGDVSAPRESNGFGEGMPAAAASGKPVAKARTVASSRPPVAASAAGQHSAAPSIRPGASWTVLPLPGAGL